MRQYSHLGVRSRSPRAGTHSLLLLSVWVLHSCEMQDLARSSVGTWPPEILPETVVQVPPEISRQILGYLVCGKDGPNADSSVIPFVGLSRQYYLRTLSVGAAPRTISVEMLSWPDTAETWADPLFLSADEESQHCDYYSVAVRMGEEFYVLHSATRFGGDELHIEHNLLKIIATGTEYRIEDRIHVGLSREGIVPIVP